MNGSGAAPGPGWDAGTASAGTAAVAAWFPAWRLPPRTARSGDSGPPEQQLRGVIGALAGSGQVSAVAGWGEEALGCAVVFRLWPAQVLHLVGDSPLAAEFRRLLTAGVVPGWDLHQVPAGHTPSEGALLARLR